MEASVNGCIRCCQKEEAPKCCKFPGVDLPEDQTGLGNATRKKYREPISRDGLTLYGKRSDPHPGASNAPFSGPFLRYDPAWAGPLGEDTMQLHQ